MARATSGCTAPTRSSSPASTPSRTCLRSVAYATTPPRNTADAPGTEVRAAPTSPPVSDSADATVRPTARSASTASTAARPTGSGHGSEGSERAQDAGSPTPGPLPTGQRPRAGAPQPGGTKRLVHAGDDPDDHRDRHDPLGERAR